MTCSTSSGLHRVLFLGALLALVLAVGFSSAAYAQTSGYDNIPDPMPKSSVSWSYYSYGVDEFGDDIQFAAGASGALQSVSAIVTNWACESGAIYPYGLGDGDCVTTTPGAAFAHDFTIRIYNVSGPANAPVLGSLITSKTANFSIPFRPSFSAVCADTTTYPSGDPDHAADRWYDAATNSCSFGFNSKITFDFGDGSVVLPERVVFGITFNTQHEGYSPTGAPNHYNAFNIAVEGAPTVGTDLNGDLVFLDSAYTGVYADDSLGLDIFRPDTNWTGYVPAAEFGFFDLDTIYVNAATGSDLNAGVTPAFPKATIQAALDVVSAGGTVYVYPGSYDETAANRTVYTAGGPYQFGLYFATNGVTLQGVDGSGLPVHGSDPVAPYITTNSTSNFGPSGVWVQGDDVTIDGVRIGPNAGGDNKTIEVIGDNFTLSDSVVDVPGGGSVYINDFRYVDGPPAQCFVNKYTIVNNVFADGTSLDISNGAGACTAASDRVIQDNTFQASAGQTWPQISFNSSGTTVPWFSSPVGPAIITGNTFEETELYVRWRGDGPGLDWSSVWNDNTFPRGAMTLESLTPFVPSAYTYACGAYSCPVLGRISNSIQDAIDVANDGDIVLVLDGAYAENLDIAKPLTLQGESQAGVQITAPTAGDYGIHVTASNVAVRNLTLTGPTGAFGLKMDGDAATGLVVENVTVQNSGRSNLDFNGPNGLTLTNVTATGSTGGNGINLSDVSNATLTNITTSGNAWGGLAIYTKGQYATAGASNITLAGTNSFGEAAPVYVELDEWPVGSGTFTPALDIDTQGYVWAVYEFGSKPATWVLFSSQAAAQALAALWPNSTVLELDMPADYFYPTGVIYVENATLDLNTGVVAIPVPFKFTRNGSPINSLQFDVVTPACLGVVPDNNLDAPLVLNPGGFQVFFNPSPDVTGATRVQVAPPVVGTPTIPDGTLIPLPYEWVGGTECNATAVQSYTFTPVNTICGSTNGVSAIPCDGTAGTVTVDFNDAPVLGSPVLTVAENASYASSVAATDADGPPADTLTYSKVTTCANGGTDNGLFTLGADGSLTGGPFNYEAVPTNTTLNVCVQVSDGHGGVDVQGFDILLTNVNEAPVLGAATLSTAENVPFSANIPVTDEDAGAVLTFSYSSDASCGSPLNHDLFLLSAAGGLTGGPFDFEALPNNPLRVCVEVTDGTFTDIAVFEITVTDANEAPTLSEPTLTVAEGSGYVSSVAAADPDLPADTLTYSFATSCANGGAENGLFAINATSGALTGGPFDYETVPNNPLRVCVSVSDGNGGVDTDGFAIAVTNILDVARGDCNVSGAINAVDLSATVLEIFDQDSVGWGGTDDTDNDWLTAPFGDFRGSPEGCDSNQGTVVAAADLICTVRIIFGLGSTCANTAAPASALPVVLSAPATPQANVVPVSLESQGHEVSATSFTLKLDSSVAFDATDSDGDGVPDAVSFNVPDSLLRMAMYDAREHAVKVVVAGMSVPLPTIEGTVAVITVSGSGSVSLENVSAGNTSGVDVPVEVKGGQVVEQIFRMFLPAVTR